MKVKNLSAEKGKACNISNFPNFHKSGSIRGMKKLYYGNNVKCLCSWGIETTALSK